MTRIELEDILEKHEKWLNNEVDGKRADLCGVDLCGADLHSVDLHIANLRGANLCDVDLRGANLRGAILCDVDLRGADLRGADLRCTNLHDANLRGADLYGANLHNADLSCAYLSGAKNLPYIPMSCPDSGSFTAWKKAHGYIVKLLIPEDARRSSATGRECRCDKAIVIAIETVDGEPAGISEIASSYDENFVYRIGETVVEPNFCEDRFLECAKGIHFFINRQEAVDY